MAEFRGNKILVVLVAVLVVLAVAVFLTWRQPTTQPSIDEGRRVADDFLTQIRERHPDAAWESTTAEFKSAEGRESFLRYVKQNPLIAKPLDFVSVQTVTVQKSPRAEYVYRSPKSGQTVRILAGNERGTWRVDRIRVE